MRGSAARVCVCVVVIVAVAVIFAAHRMLCFVAMFSSQNHVIASQHKIKQ